MKKPPTKADIRAQLERETQRFLRGGGTIRRFEPGETALEGRSSPLRTPVFNEPRQPRTPLNDVVAALDERREAFKRSPPLRRGRKPQPRKKFIYDDFGEPLRSVWVDD